MNLLVSTFLVVLSSTFVQCDKERDKLFFLQKTSGENNETLLVVTWRKSKWEISAGCEIFADEELIKEVLLSSDDSPIRTLTEEEMQNLLGDCTEFTLRRRRRNSEDWTTTNLSVENIDDYPRELRENSNGRRAPQNVRRQNDGSRRSQQNVGTQNGFGQRSPQNARRQIGDDQRSPQNVRRQNYDRRGPLPNSYARRISTTWGTNSIETETVTAVKEYFRNKTTEIPINNTTTVTPMNKTTTGTSTKYEISYDTTTEAPTTVQGYNGINIIFPGTKWCGAGDRAKSYTDLGSSEYTDKCCRAHDVCNDTLAPGETRHNITNTSSFTKLSCECDQEFYDCLDSVNSMTSNTVGNMYFNVLRRECYSKEYPLTKECQTYRSFLKITCSEYKRDTSVPKVYQWMPAKRYRKIPIPGPLTISLK